MQAARGSLLLLMDADGATSISDLDKLEAELRRICPASAGATCASAPAGMLPDTSWLDMICSRHVPLAAANGVVTMQVIQEAPAGLQSAAERTWRRTH